MIANELRRDAQNISQNDNFAVSLDTFHDRRNGFLFQTTPLAAQRDTSITDEKQNVDWSTVWNVRTQPFEGGWTVEFGIPFKSLRYGSSAIQTWGINFRRIVRWRNEVSYLSPVPSFLGQAGVLHISLNTDLEGVEMPPPGLNFEIKPYAIMGIRTDRTATPPFTNDMDRDLGADFKYGLSKSLTLDATYNTDFAQVEDDTQQVNLTRFNQFFPERRDFFLESQGLFTFGGATGTGSNTPVMFFSRRIGLNNGRPIPIAGGARLTGRIGASSFGMLNIQAREDEPSESPATNFTTFRFKRDVLRRSNIGVLYTRRDETSRNGAPTGHTIGMDGLYSLSPSINVTAYYARTEKSGVEDGNVSYLTRFDYNGDRYGLEAERLTVGASFNPEVGFVRRTDLVRDFAMARFSPRPSRDTMRAIRRFIYQGSIEYLENSAGRLDFREQSAQFGLEFVNTDRFTLDYARNYEFVPRSFEIANVTVPVGSYRYQNLLASYTLGTRRTLSGTISFQAGSLYGGDKRTMELRTGRLELSTRLALEPSASLNWGNLPLGKFNYSVVTERTTYTLTPRMFVSVLTQFNSSNHTVSINGRFRWEYRPGSELFVVYSDGRDTRLDGFPPVVNRAFVVKINKLLRF
jgi:hypothetical protein